MFYPTINFMETLMYLILAGVLVYFGRIGFIIYEILQMDFNFKQPWPEDTVINELKKKPKRVDPTASRIEVKEIEGKLIINNIARA